MQEMWVLFLHSENPLKQEMATLSSILVWKISLREERAWSCEESDMTEMFAGCSD